MGITNNIMNCNSNYYKYLSYTTNVCKDNHENNFYIAIVDKKIEKDFIHNSYISSDINNGRQNVTF